MAAVREPLHWVGSRTSHQLSLLLWHCVSHVKVRDTRFSATSLKTWVNMLKFWPWCTGLLQCGENHASHMLQPAESPHFISYSYTVSHYYCFNYTLCACARVCVCVCWVCVHARMHGMNVCVCVYVLFVCVCVYVFVCAWCIKLLHSSNIYPIQ